MAQKNRKTVEPTFEERLNAASAKTGAALSIFEKAASDLEDAAREKEFIAVELSERQAEVLAELNRLEVLEGEALAASDQDYITANKIRAFVGN